jgi:glyoxylase-like metal-dependent hydrolase (beta-lactamase superfamily II)
LLLTHTHFDHCCSAKQLQNDFGCRVLASSAAAEFTVAGYTPLSAGTTPVTKKLSYLGRGIGKLAFGYSPFQADILTNGAYDYVAEFSGIRTIQTRGHSDDSVSLILENEIAIVGDVLFGVFRHSVYPPYADDPAELLNSWKLLLSTGCRLFLPGHGREIPHVILEREYKRMAGRTRE